MKSRIIHSVWNEEELPEQWEDFIVVPVYKKRVKIYTTYRSMSLLSTTYKILSHILLSRLTPYVEEIIGDHQCVFRRNRPTTDLVFCIR
jgi:hypothetical protein